MRDLEKTLREWNEVRHPYDRKVYADNAFKEIITRAIRAEERVEVLQIVTKENYRMYINALNELDKVDELIKTVHFLEEENDKLRSSGRRDR